MHKSSTSRSDNFQCPNCHADIHIPDRYLQKCSWNRNSRLKNDLRNLTEKWNRIKREVGDMDCIRHIHAISDYLEDVIKLFQNSVLGRHVILEDAFTNTDRLSAADVQYSQTAPNEMIVNKAIQPDLVSQSHVSNPVSQQFPSQLMQPTQQQQTGQMCSVQPALQWNQQQWQPVQNVSQFLVNDSYPNAQMNQASNIFVNTPEENKYENLNKGLMEQFGDSEESKLKFILEGLELGDRKPSYLLRVMKVIAKGRIEESLLRTMWLQHLPMQEQQFLSVRFEELDKLAELADKIHEVSSLPNSSALMAASLTCGTLPNQENSYSALPGQNGKMNIQVGQTRKMNAQIGQTRKMTAQVGQLRKVNAPVGQLRKMNVRVGQLRKMNTPVGQLRKMNTPVGQLRKMNTPVGQLRKMNTPVGQLRKMNTPVGQLRKMNTPFSQLRMNTPVGQLRKMNAPVGQLRKMNAPVGQLRKMNAPVGQLRKMNTPVGQLRKMNSKGLPADPQQGEKKPKRLKKPKPKMVAGQCWYHSKFGNKATKCLKPCKFEQENSKLEATLPVPTGLWEQYS